MNRIPLFLVIAILVVLGTSCKTGPDSTVCRAGLALANKAAGTIAITLQCANTSEVAKSLRTPVQKSRVCRAGVAAPKSKSAIGLIACPLIAKGVVAAVGSQVPAKWECTTEVAGGELQKVIKSGCLKAFGL